MIGVARLNNLAASASGPTLSGQWILTSYTSTGEDYGDVVTDSNGDIYHVFTSKGATAIGVFDLIAQKISSTGTIIWQNHIGVASTTSYLPSITTDGTNLYILASILSGSNYQTRISRLLCSDGSHQNTRFFYNGTTSQGATMNAGRIINNVGAYLITSSSGPISTTSTNTFALTKIPPAVTSTTWQQRYNTTTLSEFSSYVYHLNHDGTYVYSAYYDGTVKIVKIDISTGASIFQKALTLANYAISMRSSCGTNGVTHIFSGATSPRMGQLSNIGNFNWEKTLTGMNSVAGFTDSSSNCYAAGSVSGNLQVVQIVKFDSSGAIVWRNKFTLASQHSGPYVDNIWLAGSFLYLSIRVDVTAHGNSSDRILVRILADGTGTGTSATVGGGLWSYSTSTDTSVSTLTVTQPTSATATVVTSPSAVSTTSVTMSTNTAYTTNEQANLI